MKRTILTLIAAILTVVAEGQNSNYDFWSVASNGDTLYYKILSDSTVKVVAPNLQGEYYDYGDRNGYFNHTKPSGNLIIPSNVYFNDWDLWFYVTEIGGKAFSTCDSLISVTIPDRVTAIGNYAFRDCSQLSSVNLSSNLTTIGSEAFHYCTNLSTISLPEGLLSIGYYAFGGCHSIASITLPNSLVSIGDGAFEWCTSLVGINIPDNVTSIGNACFSGCTSLSYAYIGNGITVIENMMFEDCTNLSNVHLGNNTQTIEYWAFKNCTNITTLVIPDNVTTLHQEAFMNCSKLKRLTIGSGLSNIVHPNVSQYTHVQYGPFYGCDSILYLNTNANITGTHYQNFTSLGMDKSNLKTLIIGDNVIGFSPGYCESLDSLTIGTNLFTCRLCNYAGSTLIGRTSPRYLYYNRRNTNVMQGSAYEYDNEVYGKLSGLSVAKVETLIFGDSAISVIPCYCGGDSLRTIVIGNSIQSIPAGRYSNCNNLKKITIGRSVQSIGSNAFYHCMKLDTIFALPTAAPILDSGAFAVTKPNKKVIVPCNSNYDSVWGTTGFVYITGGFSLNLASNDNSWGSATFLQSVDCEQTAIIEAIPTVGHVFVQWSDGNTDNPRTITLSQNTTLTAVFEAFNVNVSANSNNDLMGSVTGGGNQPINSEVTLTAIPACGHRFVRWNDSLTCNPRILTADKDTSFTAKFELSVDTLLVHDTTYIDVHDTTYVDVFVHDTTYIDVHDTTFVPVHDTTYVDVFVHDTTFIDVHDTTYVDVFVHDTTTITDTITLTEYVSVHDTTFVPVHDTTFFPVHDTTYIIQTDTVTNTVYDTITNTVFDTITNTIHDTITVLQIDTLWLHDTVFVHDTIYIHDTIVVGVDEVDVVNAKIYASDGQIAVEGAEGNTVWFYDINGRVLATKQDEYSPLRFDVPASGAYMVKIGNHPARKVVVIR